MKLERNLSSALKSKKPKPGGPYHLRGTRGGGLAAQANPTPHKQSKVEKAWSLQFACFANWTKTPDPRAFDYATDASDGTGWYYRDVLHSALSGKLILIKPENRVTTPTARVKRAAAQALTIGVPLALTPDSAEWDNNVFWNPLAQQSRLTIRSPGVYLIGGWCQFSAVTAGRRDAYLRLNGTTVLTGSWTHAASANVLALEPVTIWYFNDNDYLEMVALSSVAGVTALARALWVVAITPETVI